MAIDDKSVYYKLKGYMELLKLQISTKPERKNSFKQAPLQSTIRWCKTVSALDQHRAYLETALKEF